MNLISLHNIQIAFGSLPILENLSLQVHAGERIGILGRNGAGKSTLLKIMSHALKPDAGYVAQAQGVRIALLEQQVPLALTGTAQEAVAAAAGPAGEALAAYYRELAHPTDPGHLDHLQHALNDLEAWRLEPLVQRVLDQVQVAPHFELAALSGGLRRRVFLARALVQEPAVLLLDEPTNHLDLPSIAWLENHLLSTRLTVVFVTHDRRLLRQLATRIVELDRGRVIDWSCDYPTFVERKQAVLDNEEKAWAQFDKKLAQEEVWIRQGIKARRTRNEGRVRALLKMRAERRQRRTRIGQVQLAISTHDRSGDRVIEARNVSFTYGSKTLLSNFSFTLERGDRLGIIGPNGCGKTTLLNLLLGRLTPQQGWVERGAQVAPVYFDQLREGIDPEKTVWENVSPAGMDTVLINGHSRNVIGYLQDFLFTADRARTPVKCLSGGERHRLLLARLFTVPANLLVFDEPTNDLDAETLELLEDALANFPGTLIVVSHDREFLNNVVTSALIFGRDGTVTEQFGGFDDWKQAITPESASVDPRRSDPQLPLAPAQAKTARKLTFKEKQELDALPAKIEALDAEQDLLHEQLADFTNGQKPGFVASAKARLEAINAERSHCYARWEVLETLDQIRAR